MNENKQIHDLVVDIADWMVREGTARTSYGNWIFYRDDLLETWPDADFDDEHRNLVDQIVTELYCYMQVCDVIVEFDHEKFNCFDINFYTSYCDCIEDDETDGIIYKEYGENVISDSVNHPSHYTQGGIECIEAIKASMSPEAFQGYCKGNVMKYIWRSAMKNGLEDLKKAQVYLGWMIESVEKNNGKTD